MVVGRPLSSSCFGQWQIRQSYLIELRRSFAADGPSDRRRPEAGHSKTAGRVPSSKILNPMPIAAFSPQHRRERAGAINVLEIDHGAVAVLQGDFADESAQRRLMVAGGENKRLEGPSTLRPPKASTSFSVSVEPTRSQNITVR
jgi:hypothetical protein